MRTRGSDARRRFGWILYGTSLTLLWACDGFTSVERETTTVGDVVAAIESGADCGQIFEVRNKMDPRDPDRSLANEHLQSVGCFNIDSERASKEPNPLTGNAEVVSEGCRNAMRTAEAELDSARADPLIDATLSACATAREWLEALRLHPGAMGLSTAAVVSEFHLEIVCYRQEATPVCVDAAGKSLVS